MSAETRIEQLRRVVAERQHGTVEGRAVDVFTASSILACYDAGNDHTKQVIANADFDRVAAVALRTAW